GFEDVEAGIPELARALHPLRELVEGFRIQREEMIAPGNATADQAGALQQPDVLRHRVQRDVEGRRHLRHASLARGELAEDLAARLVREGDQGVVELHGRIFILLGEYVKRPWAAAPPRSAGPPCAGLGRVASR